MATKLSSLKPEIGWGGAWIDRTLADVLSGLATDGKLSHLKLSLVAGAGAGNAIPLSGITSSDIFIGAVAFAGAGTDVTDLSLITEATLGDGTITFDTDTTGAKVLVLWVDVDARSVQE